MRTFRKLIGLNAIYVYTYGIPYIGIPYIWNIYGIIHNRFSNFFQIPHVEFHVEFHMEFIASLIRQIYRNTITFYDSDVTIVIF